MVFLNVYIVWRMNKIMKEWLHPQKEVKLYSSWAFLSLQISSSNPHHEPFRVAVALERSADYSEHWQKGKNEYWGHHTKVCAIGRGS